MKRRLTKEERLEKRLNEMNHEDVVSEIHSYWYHNAHNKETGDEDIPVFFENHEISYDGGLHCYLAIDHIPLEEGLYYHTLDGDLLEVVKRLFRKAIIENWS